MSSSTRIINVNPKWTRSDVEEFTSAQKNSTWQWVLLNTFALVLIVIAFCSLPLVWLLNLEINSLSLIGATLVFVGLLSLVAQLESTLAEKQTKS